MSDFIQRQKANNNPLPFRNGTTFIHANIVCAEASTVTTGLCLTFPGNNTVYIYTDSAKLSVDLAEAINSILERHLLPEPSLGEAIDDEIPF